MTTGRRGGDASVRCRVSHASEPPESRTAASASLGCSSCISRRPITRGDGPIFVSASSANIVLLTYLLLGIFINRFRSFFSFRRFSDRCFSAGFPSDYPDTTSVCLPDLLLRKITETVIITSRNEIQHRMTGQTHFVSRTWPWSRPPGHTAQVRLSECYRLGHIRLKRGMQMSKLLFAVSQKTIHVMF